MNQPLWPKRRAVTLIELLVVVALMGLFMGAVVMGFGATTNAKIKASATMVAGAVKVAFSRSASTSKSVRIVFDIDRGAIVLEEADLPMLVRQGDTTGTDGAAAATEQEHLAEQEADRLIKGPTAPKPLFKPIHALGFEVDDPTTGRELSSGIAIRKVQVSHAAEPIESGRAYLYFWPGGQTERAAIQVGRKGQSGDDSVVTVLVSPLTGRVRIEAGAKPMERPRDDREREDRNL